MAVFAVQTGLTFLCIPDENMIFYRVEPEYRMIIINILIWQSDNEKLELGPVINWFYCMNHTFFLILIAALSIILFIPINVGRIKLFFFTHYCRWILLPVKFSIFTMCLVSGNVRLGWVNKMSMGLSCKPTMKLCLWFCGPSYILTPSPSIDHSCCQPQEFIVCFYSQCYC